MPGARVRSGGRRDARWEPGGRTLAEQQDRLARAVRHDLALNFGLVLLLHRGRRGLDLLLGRKRRAGQGKDRVSPRRVGEVGAGRAQARRTWSLVFCWASFWVWAFVLLRAFLSLVFLMAMAGDGIRGKEDRVRVREGRLAVKDCACAPEARGRARFGGFSRRPGRSSRPHRPQPHSTRPSTPSEPSLPCPPCPTSASLRCHLLPACWLPR